MQLMYLKDKLFCVITIVVYLFFLIGTTAETEQISPAQETLATVNFNKAALAKEVYEILKRAHVAQVIVTLVQPDLLCNDTTTDKRLYQEMVHAQNHFMEEAILNDLPQSDFTERYRFDNFAGFSGEITESGLQILLSHPSVRFVEPIRILKPHLAQGIPLMNAATVRSSYSGDNVSIAICDTGVDYNHSCLGNSGFPNAKVIGGYDFGDDDNDPKPNGESHGTCCAGIAAGDLATRGDYIGGVAYNAKIYAMKISTGSTGSATSDAMIAAWDWCITHQDDNPDYPIMVISTSFGGGRHYSATEGDAISPAMTTAARSAVAAGITVLASSGNDGYCDSIGWPAAISCVISVGAVYDANFGTHYPCVHADSCAPKTATTGCSTGYCASDTTMPDRVTSYSNTASFLTLLAPSNQTYTSDIVGASGYSSGDYYDSFGGTSAACPYAAGAVACLQSSAQVLLGRYMTVTEVRDTLINTGEIIKDPKVAITKPRIDLEAAANSFACGKPGTLVIPDSSTTGSYSISWAPSDTSGVVYLLQEATNSNFTTELRTAYFGTTNNTFITGRINGTRYFYRVKATKSGFGQSLWSVGANSCLVTLTPGTLSIPEMSITGNYTISWGASVSSNASYVLEEATDSSFTINHRTVYTGSDTNAFITGQDNNSYFYRLKEIGSDRWHIGANSCHVTLTCEVPDSLIVPATSSSEDYTVSWNSSRTADVTYVLEETTEGVSSSAWRIAYSGTDLSASITGRNSGSTYCYRIKATRTGYADSPWCTGNNGCTVTLVCGGADGINIPKENKTGSFIISWSASPTSDVTYVLEEAVDSNFTEDLRTAYLGKESKADIAERECGMTYYYRVKATKNGYDDSGWRIGDIGCSIICQCELPSTLTVPNTNTTGNYQISWSSSKTKNVTYVLEEATDKNFLTGLITVYSGTATSVIVASRRTGNTYYYRIKAIREGYLDSDWLTGNTGCSIKEDGCCGGCQGSGDIKKDIKRILGDYMLIVLSFTAIMSITKKA